MRAGSSLYREALRAQGVLSSGELEGQRDGQTVRVAGLVVVRQRPPRAKGHVFITLEDEEGLVDLIVRPDVSRGIGVCCEARRCCWSKGDCSGRGTP